MKIIVWFCALTLGAAFAQSNIVSVRESASCAGCGAMISDAPLRVAPDLVCGFPKHGKRFALYMNPSDTIGSVYRCEDRIHANRWTDKRGKLRHDTGVCSIPPGSIKPGKHSVLQPRYAGIFVSVKTH